MNVNRYVEIRLTPAALAKLHRFLFIRCNTVVISVMWA